MTQMTNGHWREPEDEHDTVRPTASLPTRQEKEAAHETMDQCLLRIGEHTAEIRELWQQYHKACAIVAAYDYGAM